MGQQPADSGWKFGTRTFQAGETVFREGDLAAEAYIVESGGIDIVMNRSNGSTVLGSLSAGAVFGEMALIDNTPRMADAVCTQDCVLRVIPVDVFEAKMANADPFVRAIVRVLARNARVNTAATDPA